MRSGASSQSSLRGSSEGDGSRPGAPRTARAQAGAEQQRMFLQSTLVFENKGLGDAGVAKVARRLRENASVTMLDLRNNNVGDAGARDVAAVLRTNQVLQQLVLADNNIGDPGGTELMHALHANTTLVKLDLRFNSLTQGAADAACGMLTVNTTLRRLDLQLNNIGRHGAGSIARGLQQNSGLRWLSLGFNNVGDQGAAALANALRANTTLQRLQLPNNNIGNDGTRSLAEALAANRTLTDLDIHRNDRITDQGVRDFETLLEQQQNRTLTHLDLGQLPPGIERALQRNRTLHDSRGAGSSCGSRDGGSRASDADRGSIGCSSGDDGAGVSRRRGISSALSSREDGARSSAVPYCSAESAGHASGRGTPGWDGMWSRGSDRYRNADRGLMSDGSSGLDADGALAPERAQRRHSRNHRTPEAPGRRGSAVRRVASPAAFRDPRGLGSDHGEESRGEPRGAELDPGELSRALFEARRLPQEQRLLEGTHHFYGRDWRPLAALRSAAPVLPRGSEGPLQPEEHCVVVVERALDPRLRHVLQRGHSLVGPVFDIRTRVQTLALLVCNYMGGTGQGLQQRHREAVARAKRDRRSNVVPLCELEQGGTRHRALLFKYLCDHLGVSCSLEAPQSHTQDHLWNVVQLGVHRSAVVDLADTPGELYPCGGEAERQYCTTGCGPPPGGDDARAGGDTPGSVLPGVRYLTLPDSTAQLKRHGKLGGGSTGSVFRCTLGGVTFAMKKVQMAQSYQQRIREIVILEQLCHDNVVRYLGHEVARDDDVMIFMEYLPWSLHSWMRKLRTEGASFRDTDMFHIALDVAKGLHYLHENAPLQIVHRDLKSKNILLDIDADDEIKEVKLCDFGVSKIVTREAAPETMVGTYYWMAPEILRNDHSGYTVQADIWSFGMVCVELLTLRSPYYENGSDWGRTRSMILRGLPPRLPAHSPRKMRELIASCLVLNPGDRPGTRDIIIRMVSD